MKNESIFKLMQVWESKNTILKPVERKDVTEIVDQIANLFAAGTFYYLIMNFETLELEYVSEGVKTLLGVNPKELTLKKFLYLLHPEDLEKLHEKETASLNFKLNEIHKKDINKYKTVYLLRVRGKHGDYRTILHQAKALSVSDDGKVFQAISIHTDITHLNPTIDHKISFISNELPSFYSIETGNYYKLEKSDFKNLFTKREKEIIMLVAKGKQTKEIAVILFLSIHTVNSHKKNIYRKAKCKNSTELIANCIREGII